MRVRHLVALAGAACAPESAIGESCPPLRLSEVVALSTWFGGEGDTGHALSHPDWIELHNASDRRLTLTGFGLDSNGAVWRFGETPDPSVTFAPVELGADGYLVVYADGLLYLGPRHASFDLTSNPQDIELLGPEGQHCERVGFTALHADTSFARCGDPEAPTWVVDHTPTPGAPNDCGPD